MMTLVANNPDVERAPRPDVHITELGTLTVLTLWTPEAIAWVNEHADFEPWQCHGLTLTVESNYVGEMLSTMLADGLVLEEMA